MSHLERLRQLFDFDHWANGRALERATDDDTEALREMGHVYFAQDVWYQRITTGTFPDGREPFAAMTIAAVCRMRDDWLPRWRALLDGQTTDPDQALIAFTQAGGAELTLPLAEILQHVINHGTHHRGKAIAALRRAGREPLNVDYMCYIRLQRGLPLPS
jgi:uncharacterized damage-inducible protein DinB